MSFRFLSVLALGFALSGFHLVSAADKPIPIAAFVHPSMYSLPKLSPDGKYLAVRVNIEINGRDTKVMSVYDLADMKLVSTMRMSIFELPSNFEWVSNTRLVVTKAQDLGFLEQPVNLGEILATDFDGQNQRYLYGYRRTSYYQGGASNGLDDYGSGYIHYIPDQLDGTFMLRERKWGSLIAHTPIYEVNATNGLRKLVADVGAKDLGYLFQHDGKPRVAAGAGDNLEPIAYLRSQVEDKWTPIPAESLGKGFNPLVFTPDDKGFFFLFSENGGPDALMRQQMANGERKLIAREKSGDIDRIQYGPAPYQPFATATSVGIPTIHYIDENSPDAILHKQIRAQFPGSYVNFASFSADGSKLLFIVSSDREPGEYYIFDRKTKSADFLVALQPLIEAARMAERKPIQFKARDGLELNGYLTLPPGSNGKKLPLVLLPHGGPQGINDEWFWDADSQFLASRGYAVLQVNYRGSGGRGANFFNAGYGQWATGMVQDLIDGVRWTTAEGISDASRICVYGGSYGAYAAMMASVAEPELFKCAVGYSGLYDLTKMSTQVQKFSSDKGINFITKAIGNDPEKLRQNSPAFLADKIKIPVLLVHGDQDEVTPPEQAEAMRTALKNANKNFEWMMVPKEGHGFYAEKNRYAFYEKLEAFLAKNLGP